MATFRATENGISLRLDVRSGAAPVMLSGREIEAATVIFRDYENVYAFDALASFMKELSPAPILPDHVVYGSNNWYYAYGKSSHGEIISDSKLVAKMTEGCENRPYMVIDDGWQPNPCAGPWVANESYGDMKKVADEFKKMGVRPGIWVRFLRDDTDAIPAKWRFENYNGRLDPSHPEVIAHVKETVRRIVLDWGFELIKHDFSSYDVFGLWGKDANKYLPRGEWKFYDRTRTAAEIYVDFCRAILDAAEGKAYILGCNCVSHLTAGLCHVNRIGDDTSGVEFDRTRRMGVNALAFRLPQNGRFYMADADCAGFVKGKIPFSLNKEWVTLLAKSGTPLFISAPDGAFTDEEFAYMKEMYKIASLQKNVARPLDWLYNATPAKWSIDGKETSFLWFDDGGADF
jgi:alpha-galactosidase